MSEYTPPAGNDITLDFHGDYTPPTGNDVVLDFGGESPPPSTGLAGYTLSKAAAQSSISVTRGLAGLAACSSRLFDAGQIRLVATTASRSYLSSVLPVRRPLYGGSSSRSVARGRLY